MIKAYQKDEFFLQEVRQVDARSSHFQLWWLGQSGFLLHWQGHFLLLDPYLSDSLTEKYAQTDKPHIRMSERVVDPARLDFVDLVTSSHNHTDHLDAATLLPLFAANPGLQLVIPEANRDFVADRLQCNQDLPTGLDAGAQITVGPFTLHGLPAAHNELAKDQDGRHLYLGYVITFGPWTVYHSGDTLWYAGMQDWLRPFGVDVALLPINGNLPERRVAGNLDTEEAARLGKAIGARLVIPCHYDMFTFNTADPADFARAAEQVGQAFRILQIGQGWSSREL